ncbi:MAG: HAD family hydrolase [Micropruina sp.]|nr:HAD family hydrolase [Micropruina sp.]
MSPEMGQVPEIAWPLRDFVPRQDFFVGIDSDGCVMDSMERKHRECFTPCAIEYWGLEPIADLARETSLFVNLSSTTRGLNRWLALRQVFDLLRDRTEVAERGVRIPEYPELTDFINSEHPLSDQGIAAFADEHPSATIRTAIAYGEAVNAAVAALKDRTGPFPGVLDAIRRLAQRADCMTISATRLRALVQEWTAFGLAPWMQAIAGQEMGSKARQLAYAAGGKYPPGHVLLIGDAPGDRDAAARAQCLYYPINPGRERESWARFTAEALPRFLEGSFAGAYQHALIAEFEAYLPDEVPWPTISGGKRFPMPLVKG